MTLRADHAAGAFFVAFGLLVFAISTDLPFGNLSLPGSGFLPIILAAVDHPVRHRADGARRREQAVRDSVVA